MRLAVVVPTMRPEMAASVIRQWRAQTVQVPLIVVLNGRADNSTTASLYQAVGASVVPSPMGKATCLRAGESAASALGATHVSFWDDDDIYTSRYLEPVMRAFNSGAEWCGQRAHYMRTGDDRLWLLGDSGGVLGCCLSSRVGLARWDMPDAEIGPEQSWAKAHGVPPTVIPRGFFAQHRSSLVAHVWPVSDVAIAQRFGGAVDLGEWSAEVVAGETPEPHGVLVPVPDGPVWDDALEMMNRWCPGIPSAEVMA